MALRPFIENPLGSVQGLIEASRPTTSSTLCPAVALDRLLGLGDVLGPNVAWALYECPLASPGRVDLAVLLGAGQGRAQLRQRLVDEPERWPPGWADAGRALVAWLLPGHPVAEARQLSLEWDCDPLPGAPFPFVTFELAPGMPTDGRRALRIAEAMSTGVDGRPLSSLDRAVVEAMPPGGSILHFGCQGSRGEGAHRWVCGMSPSRVAAFLEDLAWSGDAQALGTRAAAWGAHAAHVSVHLDVGPRLGPRVGLEVFYPGPPRSDHRWSAVLSTLGELGLATPAALEAVQDWPGEGNGLTRLLDLKVVFIEDRPVLAKAYLAFCATAPRAATR